jgi:hypothetical protein
MSVGSRRCGDAEMQDLVRAKETGQQTRPAMSMSGFNSHGLASENKTLLHRRDAGLLLDALLNLGDLPSAQFEFEIRCSC